MWSFSVSLLLTSVSGVITQRQWTTKISPSSNQESAMSAKVETTVRQWSTPVEKVIEGQPPRPVSSVILLNFIFICDLIIGLITNQFSLYSFK